MNCFQHVGRLVVRSKQLDRHARRHARQTLCAVSEVTQFVVEADLRPERVELVDVACTLFVK